MKVSEATGPVLDWMVAKAIGDYKPVAVPAYSTDWAQGGPIIEREGITLMFNEDDHTYAAHVSQFRQRGMSNRSRWRNGPTPLIAAMRCYVASKLGEEVEVPEGL